MTRGDYINACAEMAMRAMFPPAPTLSTLEITQLVHNLLPKRGDFDQFVDSMY